MTSEQEFIKMIKYSGLEEFHKAGHTGSGLKVLCCQDDTTEHGRGIINIFKRCAPEAIIINGAHLLSFKNGKMIESSITVEGVKYNFEEYIINNKFDIVFSSASAPSSIYNNIDWISSCKRMTESTGVIFNNSAGNVGENKNGEELAHRFPTEYSILWGSIGLSDSGTTKRLNSCLSGRDLMFMAFAPLIGGTSAACPFGTGIIACLMSKYGKMTYQEVYQMLKTYSKDFGINGKDIYYGEGMPILPSPSQEDYEMITKTNIKVGDKILTVNRILKNEENYIRLRDLEDILGIVTVSYDSINKIPVIKD